MELCISYDTYLQMNIWSSQVPTVAVRVLFLLRLFFVLVGEDDDIIELSILWMRWDSHIYLALCIVEFEQKPLLNGNHRSVEWRIL